MTFCAQYGNRFSFYGNIQYGRFALPIKGYGAWPEERPAQPGMLVSDWQEPALQQAPDTTIADNIAIIKRLRAQLQETQDAARRMALRDQIEKARQEKVRAFQRAARIDEEETSFILLH